ncbi:MAG: hypothetical protein SFU86_06620 [Pirellulaceae bacterium]|nr:hypothetical protein [Pirellulaceae bacterium]
MDRDSRKPLTQPPSVATLIIGCALLAAVIVPVAGILGWYGHARSGFVGIQAAALAGIICWCSSALALAAAFVGQRLGMGLQSLLFGILLRTGLPLLFGVLLQEQGGALAEAGVFVMILILYLCSLVAETLLALRLIPATSARLGGTASPVDGA